MARFAVTRRADAANHIVHRVALEIVRQLDFGNGHIFETVHFAALLAVEMYMLIIYAVMIAPSDFIFQRTAVVFNYIDDILLSKQFKNSENARLIY